MSADAADGRSVSKGSPFMRHSMKTMVVAATLITSLAAASTIYAQESAKPGNVPVPMMAPGMMDQDSMMKMMNQMSQMMENCSRMMQAKVDQGAKGQSGKPLDEPSQSPEQPG
jgi:hypothetical protein